MRVNLPVTNNEYDFPADELLMSTTDTKGVMTHCNAPFARVSGYSMEELMDQPHNLIRHPDMPPEAYKDMWSTIGRGRSWTGFVKNRRKNGNASKLSKGPSGSLLFVQCRLDQLSFGHRGQAIANAAARVPERYP